MCVCVWVCALYYLCTIVHNALKYPIRRPDLLMLGRSFGRSSNMYISLIIYTADTHIILNIIFYYEYTHIKKHFLKWKWNWNKIGSTKIWYLFLILLFFLNTYSKWIGFLQQQQQRLVFGGDCCYYSYCYSLHVDVGIVGNIIIVNIKRWRWWWQKLSVFNDAMEVHREWWKFLLSLFYFFFFLLHISYGQKCEERPFKAGNGMLQMIGADRTSSL